MSVSIQQADQAGDCGTQDKGSRCTISLKSRKGDVVTDLAFLSLVTAASMVFQVTWSRPCLLAFVISVTETFQTDPQLKQHILNRQLQEVYLLHTMNQSRAKPRSPKDLLDNK